MMLGSAFLTIEISRLIKSVLHLPLLACLAFAAPISVRGQHFPFDQVHLAVPDVEKAMKWYQNVLGGLPVQGEPANRLFFGDVRVCFLRSNAPQPNGNPSINHVAFSVSDPNGTVSAVVKSGGSQDGPSDHEADGIMIQDPWGTKLELLPGGDAPTLDHVAIRCSDPPSEVSWFQRLFGGAPANLYGSPGLRFGEVALSFSKGLSMRSEGTSIDHIGWRTPDIDQTVLRLRVDSVRFLSDIEPRGSVVRVVFVESPCGVKVEILQR